MKDSQWLHHFETQEINKIFYPTFISQSIPFLWFSPQLHFFQKSLLPLVSVFSSLFFFNPLESGFCSRNNSEAKLAKLHDFKLPKPMLNYAAIAKQCCITNNCRLSVAYKTQLMSMLMCCRLTMVRLIWNGHGQVTLLQVDFLDYFQVCHYISLILSGPVVSQSIFFSWWMMLLSGWVGGTREIWTCYFISLSCPHYEFQHRRSRAICFPCPAYSLIAGAGPSHSSLELGVRSSLEISLLTASPCNS